MPSEPYDPSHETYYIVGVTGTTPTSRADKVLGHLWNPSSTRRIKVWEVHAYMTETGAVNQRWDIRRTTTRGTTPGSTVTPDADNSAQGDDAPPSGAVLELAEYATEPTLASPGLVTPGVWGRNAVGPDGFIRVFSEGIVVPPGTGLAVTHVLADFFTGPFTIGFVFDD